MKKYYPTLTTELLISSILDPQKRKYQNETGILKQSQLKPLAKKRKTKIEWLNTKDSIVAFDEIVEYYQLPEISLCSDPL
ncbi:18732_t:CDS:2, partial [Funneliformis geosporum]